MRYFSVPCKVLTAAHRDLLLKFDYVGSGEKNDGLVDCPH